MSGRPPRGFRCVLVPARVGIQEDVAAELGRFGAIREKHGIEVPPDAEHLASLVADQQVCSSITPDGPACGFVDVLGPGLSILIR